MKYKFLYLSIKLLLISVVGCSNNQVESNKDSNEYIKKVAWEYIKEKGWNDSTNKDWQNAEVTQTIADNKYELLNNEYEGEKVMSVTFEDKKNALVGTPIILVAPDTNEVIGYVAGE
ncbi:hypothetical protein [Alkalihalobacillus sp. AL-G]|uniref:hypothetical protein n=1 Tax=Alkalihalobacillus sp. AL-G TaxID=2926399 RepID=UPI00272A4844|nr:hypothetical protein [Alkalihalobacillus sp. AL-G]WLD92495.1 hypothetical protein MOJ78_15965 [Alkalihalobacillus sp. AL-G]